MTKLSLFDQLFYKAEQAGLPPLYMAGVMIMDASRAPFKLTPKIVADHLGARMERIPLMRKKIVQDALRIGSVRLIDDSQFDVRRHITTIRLPAPGGYAEFTRCIGEFSEQALDLSIPPWHYQVIDGLEGGRMALAIHLHHAVMDGLGAQEALSSLYDLKPLKPEKLKRGGPIRSAEPVSQSLLSSALLENAERVFVKTPKYIFNSGVPLAKSLAALLSKQLKVKETPDPDAHRLPEIKKTSLNSGVMTAKRAVSYVELPIDDARAIRKHFQCSINDLALVLNGAALEHYFKGLGETVDFDLVAVMPMNARKAGETGPGNVLTIARVNLHNTIADLATRLTAIAKDTAVIKTQHRSTSGASIDGRSLMELFSPLVIDSVCFAVAGLKLANRVLLGNVAITNVPGSPVALFIAGAPVVSGVPMAPVLGGVLALTISVSSTEKYLLFGYHGDAGAIKDKELFVEGARLSFAHLRDVAVQAAAAQATAAPAPVLSAKPARSKPTRAKPKRTTAGAGRARTSSPARRVPARRPQT
jgi:diacylglycerol O-acyltransferase / wax synthase